MKVAFDGKKAAENKAGLGNYSRFVIKCLAERFPESEFDIYVSRENDSPLLSSLKALPNVNICYPTHPLLKYFPSLWELFGLPYEIKKRGADIYHGLANVLPANVGKIKGVRKIVTVHDLIFLSFPHTYNWLDRHFYNLKFKASCRKADRIVAVSKCTAKDIMKYYFIPKDRISLVYQGCDSSFRQKCSESYKDLISQRLRLPKKFILSVGTIEERKNTALIVKALPQLQDYDLVIVGKRTKYTAYVEAVAKECGVTDRLHILTNVGFRELPVVYQMADVFVYPSRYEGFGIPMLEALCSGVPAVGATGSCLEEAGGDGALYIDPDDVGQLVETIRLIESDAGTRERMISKGFDHAGKFTDESLADDLMAVYSLSDKA